jgi:5-methylthioadenosine/S-adenosylhomocysteine deaminase
LFAHCINVDDADLELIRQSHSGVAHCPKSNAKLGHGHAPFAGFIAQGIHVGLGSDSVASNNTCDILEEARAATLLARLPPSGDVSGRKPLTAPDLVTAEQALFAATLGGARALGRDDQIGALAPGMQADIAVVGLDGMHQQPVRDPFAALVFASSGRDVLLTMIAGKEVYRAGRVNGVDESTFVERLAELRIKIDSTA